MNKKLLIAVLSIATPIIGCVIWYYQTHHENHTESNTQTIIHEEQKTDAEVILEGGKELLALHKANRENKKREESIRKANRKQQWVYQLGEPMDSKEAVLEMYKKLNGMKSVAVFKESKKNYLLFVDNGLNQQEALDALEEFKASVPQDIVRLEVMDLMKKCGKKKEVIKTEAVSIRKDTTQVACYECARYYQP